MLRSLKEFAITQVINRLAQSLPYNAKHYLVTHALAPEANALATTLDRRRLAHIYLRGEGLELGALNNPLPVPSHAKVRYVDFASAENVGQQFPGQTVKAPDIIDDALTLSSIADCSQDFLIACHILEHLEDPIGALKNWFRVLKPNGILFVSIPDRRFTFDFYRKVTPFEHLLEDHERGPASSRESHFAELKEQYRSTYGVQDEELLRRLVDWHRNGRGHTHFHVWTQLEMLELFVNLRRSGIIFDVECFCASENEGTFVLWKGARENVEFAENCLSFERREVAKLIKNLTK